MRPKTKRQKQYAEWAGMLPPLDEKRKEWAKKLFPPQALYYSRRGNNCEFWCQCCGAIVPTLGKWLLTDYAAGPWTCPECGAVCEVLPQYSGGFSHDRNTRTGERSKPSDDVLEDLTLLNLAPKKVSDDVVTKLIIECCYLTDDEKVLACRLAKKAGFDFVKTSTGFGSGGATVEDVALMRKTVGKTMGVKAAGGIRTLDDAMKMLEAGANRLGCSAGVEIVESLALRAEG